MDVSEETKTFILLDFHTYASELRDVLMGGNPKYDFSVLYEMEADSCAIVHSLAESCIQVELYVLGEKTPPRLFACASVPTLALLNPSGMVAPPFSL